MAKKHTAKAELVTVGDSLVTTDSDETFAISVGQQVITFVKGLALFFSAAKELELEALETRRVALATVLPTSADEGVRLQEDIKAANARRKELVEHWAICSTVHQFHRRLTGRRDIGDKAYEEAAIHWNRLHDTYRQAEKRKAHEQEEADRRAREAEERLKREQELLEAEQAAVALEEASPELSKREQAFVDAYTSQVPTWRGNGQRSADVAGFKDPLKTAARLLTLPKIQAAIKAKLEAAAVREQAAARAAQPLQVVNVPAVKPNYKKAAGAVDREYWSAEIYDVDAFVAAVWDENSGIPRDVLVVDPAKVNGYARQMEEKINHWPGVRAKRRTGVV